MINRCRQGYAASLATLRALLVGVLLLASFSAAAHEFAFKDIQGKVQHLSDYRGKWVLVNFWATWCPPCLDEIPDLIALHNAHKDTDLVVIGIALDYASSKGVIDFAAKHAISYPVILGDHKMAAQVGKVESLPTTILFDPTGKPVGHQEGVVTRASVEEYIQPKTKDR